jgi:hypothetical protein
MSVRAYRILDTAVGDSVLPTYFSTGAPTNGTTGTLAGAAPVGALLLTAEPAIYQNTGSKSSPTWSAAIGPQSGVAITGGTIAGVTSFGATAPLTNSASEGTPATGVTAVEAGDGVHHRTTLTLNTTLGAIAGGAALGVGALLYTLPAGAQVINSSQMNVGITQTTGHINANTPTVGLGTVIASGAVSVLSGTATFQNINVGKAAANCTGTQTEQTEIPTAGLGLVMEVGGTKTIYFNAAATWSASGDPAALVTGTVVIDWTTLA